jgi:hypothetical protein
MQEFTFHCNFHCWCCLLLVPLIQGFVTAVFCDLTA